MGTAGSDRKMKKKLNQECVQKKSEGECDAISGCKWSVGKDALEIMIDNLEEDEDVDADENVFAVDMEMESSVKESVYKTSLYAMSGIAAVGCVLFVIYKKRKLSMEVETANTSLGESEEEILKKIEYGSI